MNVKSTITVTNKCHKLCIISNVTVYVHYQRNQMNVSEI
jgi:hypothetical protein